MPSSIDSRRRRMQLVFPADRVADEILMYIDSFPGGRSPHRAFAVLDLVRRGWASLQDARTAAGPLPARPDAGVPLLDPIGRASSVEDVVVTASQDRQTKVEISHDKRDNAMQGEASSGARSGVASDSAGEGVKNALRGLMNGGS